MNSENFQGIKSACKINCFSILMINNQKGNWENNSIYNSSKKNKIHKHTLSQRGSFAHCKLKTLLKNIRKDENKCIDIPNSCTERKYCQDGDTTQSNQQIQSNTQQNPNSIFEEINKHGFTWNVKRPRIAKTSLKRTKLEVSHFLISKLIPNLN